MRAGARARAVLLGRPGRAVEDAVTVEEVARLALLTTVLDPEPGRLTGVRDKHTTASTARRRITASGERVCG